MQSQKERDVLLRSGVELMRSQITDDELRAALQEANLPTLLPALAQLTGDERWLTGPYRPTPAMGVDDHDGAGLPEDVQQAARDEAFTVLRAWHDGLVEPAPPPSPEQLEEWLNLSLGGTQKFQDGFGALLAAELGIHDRDIEPVPSSRIEVLIIGTGLSGLCAAAKLKAAGIPFTILDKNLGVGGTWLENTYPGCGVDTPSHLYCFSFAQKPAWARYFAKRDELHDYLEQLTDKYDLRAHIQFDSDVESMEWDDAAQLWQATVRNAAGARRMVSANAVITGVGLLNRPAYPSIPGLDTFDGPCLHTSRWDNSLDLTGKRVVVIGTGASAMQFVPAVVDRTEHVTVFQRSPQWGLPAGNYMRDTSDSARFLMEHVPFYMGWYRLRLVWNFGDRLYPALQVDPDWPHPERSVSKVSDKHREFLTEYIKAELGERQDLLEKCLPTYPPYAKRPLLDYGWFRTMTRDDVTLLTNRVVEVRANSVVDSDGVEHPCDVLVLATGFKATKVLSPMEIRGRSGRRLHEIWGEDDARAYYGTTVPDFPNFFLLLGPNTFAAHGGSAALTIEMQVHYVMQLLALLAGGDVSSVEVRQEVHDAYDAKLTAALVNTIWAHPGMTTYYRNAAGRVVIPMPWTNVDYLQMTDEVDLDDFVLVPAKEPAAAPAS